MPIELVQTSFGYGGREVVRVEHLALRVGECLGIFGPNGSGKTTLVRGLVGLLAPMSGRVTATAVSRTGYLPQRRSIEQHWPMSAVDAASLATSCRSLFGWITSDQHRRVKESMTKLSVDDLAHRRFATLSGGQQQRVLLAGALADQPGVLVLDEPTDGLDAQSRDDLFGTLRAAMDDGLSTVLISHESDDLAELANTVAVVTPARSAGEASGVEVIPTDAFVAGMARRRA